MPTRREHWHHGIGYWEWVKVIRRLPISSTEKLVAYALATFADFEDGHNARPGIDGLMDATSLKSDKTVRAALQELRRLGLIVRTSEGSKAGRRGWADVYALALHDEARAIAGKKPCDCGGKP